ncbi:MAG: TIGR02186 family protein [Bacillota bacterium]
MKKISILVLALMIVLTCISVAQAGVLNADVNPGNIKIDSKFDGAKLNISGNVPDGASVFIKVTSPNDAVLELNKKGKVGFLWMNVENTTVTGVPKLYKIVTSSPLDRVPAGLRDELGLSPDFKSLYSSGVVKKHTESGKEVLTGSDAVSFIESLIGIYKSENLYSVSEGDVEIKDGKYTATIDLPPNIPQEKCSVTVYAVKNGSLVDTAVASFDVGSVGIVEWLSREAVYSGPEYGFICVLIALFFGAGVAMLFSFVENLLSGGKKTGFNPGAGH